jgi:hypothetical protein
MVKDFPNNVLKTVMIGRVAASIMSGSTFSDNTVLYRDTLDSPVGNSFNIRVLDAPRGVRASHFLEHASKDHPPGGCENVGTAGGGGPKALEQRRRWPGARYRSTQRWQRAIGQTESQCLTGRINRWSNTSIDYETSREAVRCVGGGEGSLGCRCSACRYKVLKWGEHPRVHPGPVLVGGSTKTISPKN